MGLHLAHSHNGFSNDGKFHKLGVRDLPRKKHYLRRVAYSRGFHIGVLCLILLGFFRRASISTGGKITPSLGLPDRLMHSWAQYSPYFPVDEYREPSGCTITQVNIIQRHGARFPTSGASSRMERAVSNLKNATEFHCSDLEFLQTYTYDLGRDDLVPFGEAQSYDAGQEAFRRYSHLVSKDKPPFVRASSAPRVVTSAINWTAGFIRANGGVIIPAAPLIISEAANDTLDDKMCDNAGGSDAQKTAWQNIFAPDIVMRFNKVAPGATISNVDIPSLLSLCAFDSLAKETASPWCKVFKQQDFDHFEYYGDLDKYYNTGYGQPLGPVQGVGYVNELLARLTGSPVNDSTQTNTTLDASPVTFPLDRTLYADFSHDNQMIAIYAAMGILRPIMALDPTYPDPRRTWLTSHLVPFSGRLVTERLHCKDLGPGVRMLINDAVVPLEICGAGQDGICSLNAFVKSQAYARNNGEGDWQKCFT